MLCCFLGCVLLLSSASFCFCFDRLRAMKLSPPETSTFAPERPTRAAQEDELLAGGPQEASAFVSRREVELLPHQPHLGLRASRPSPQTFSSFRKSASRQAPRGTRPRSWQVESAAATRCGEPRSRPGSRRKEPSLNGTPCPEGLEQPPGSLRGFNGSHCPSQRTS